MDVTEVRVVMVKVTEVTVNVDGDGGGAGDGNYRGDIGCDAMGDMGMLEVMLTMGVVERMATRRGG